MNNNINDLQDRIRRVVKKSERGITFTEEELIHPMYRNGPYWIDIDKLEYYEENTTTIEKNTTKYLLDYQWDLNRPVEVCLIENGTYEIEGNNLTITSGRGIIANGHHRKTMFITLGMNRMLAFIRTDFQTMKEVQEYYVRLNESLKKEKKNNDDIYRSNKHIEGSVDADIDEIFTSTGIDADRVDCKGTLRTIYNDKGRSTLYFTCLILYRAFYNDPDSLKHVIFKNISDNIYRHIDEVENPGYVDNYVKLLKEKSATEWKEKFTPPSTEKMARPSLKNINSRIDKSFRDNIIAKKKGDSK